MLNDFTNQLKWQESIQYMIDSIQSNILHTHHNSAKGRQNQIAYICIYYLPHNL